MGRKILCARPPPPSLSAGRRPGVGASLSRPGSCGGRRSFLGGGCWRADRASSASAPRGKQPAPEEEGRASLRVERVIKPPDAGPVVFLVSRGCGRWDAGPGVCARWCLWNVLIGARRCWSSRGRGMFWNELFSGRISRSGVCGKQEWPRGQVLLLPLPQCLKVGLGCSKVRLMLIHVRSTVTNLRRPLPPADIIKGWHMMS